MIHSVLTVIAYLGIVVGAVGVLAGRFRFFRIRRRATAFAVLILAGVLLYFTKWQSSGPGGEHPSGTMAQEEAGADELQVSPHFKDIPLYPGALLKGYAPAEPSGEVAEHEVYHIPSAALEGVSKWYKKTMPGYGWKLRNDTGTALFFEKAEREAFIGMDQIGQYLILTIVVSKPETGT